MRNRSLANRFLLSESFDDAQTQKNEKMGRFPKYHLSLLITRFDLAIMFTCTYVWENNPSRVTIYNNFEKKNLCTTNYSLLKNI